MGAERNSIYSATGVGPTIQGERNSVYAKQGDGASIRSGLLGHTRGDSMGGSAAAMTNSLAGARDGPGEKGDRPLRDENVPPNERDE